MSESVKPTFFVCDECAFPIDEIAFVDFSEPETANVIFRGDLSDYTIENPENVKALFRALTLQQ